MHTNSHRPRASRVALALGALLLGAAVVPAYQANGSAALTELAGLRLREATALAACAPNASPAKLPEDLMLPNVLNWGTPVAEPALWRDNSVSGGTPLGFCALRVDGGFNADAPQDRVAQAVLEELTIKGWDVHLINTTTGGVLYQALRSNEVLAISLNSRENPAASTAGAPARYGAEARLAYAVNPFVLPVPRPPAPLRLGIVRAVQVSWGDDTLPGVGAYSPSTEIPVDVDAVRASLLDDLTTNGWTEATSKNTARPGQVWQIVVERAGARLIITLVGGAFTPASANPMPNTYSIGYEYVGA